MPRAAMRRLARVAVLTLLAASPALASAPERSPVPPARPAPAEVAARPSAAVTAEPSGVLRRRAPLPRPARVQLPESMVPVRPPTVALPRPEGPRPQPRPASRPAPLATPIPQGALALALPPPGAARPAARTGLVAGDHPLAPARSVAPLRRSAAAQARHAEALRRAAQPVAQAAGARSAGLCGVPTLEGRRLPRITSQVQGCGVADPVSVTVAGGVRLSRPATLDCDTARALDRWVREAVRPAFAGRGGGVSQIHIAAHYTCRTRNNRAGARISEHGRGRAIDIAGFRLASGETVTVLGDWRRGADAQALRRVHDAACGIFRTTLGPGSDGMHEDHFHYDLARHRNGGTFCR